MAPKVPFGKEMRKEFLFDEDYLNLNHGTIWSELTSLVDITF